MFLVHEVLSGSALPHQGQMMYRVYTIPSADVLYVQQIFTFSSGSALPRQGQMVCIRTMSTRGSTVPFLSFLSHTHYKSDYRAEEQFPFFRFSLIHISLIYSVRSRLMIHNSAEHCRFFHFSLALIINPNIMLYIWYSDSVEVQLPFLSVLSLFF